MVRAEPLSEGGGKVAAAPGQEDREARTTRSDPLPLNPRDADVVRAKQRLYERETHAAPPDR